MRCRLNGLRSSCSTLNDVSVCSQMLVNVVTEGSIKSRIRVQRTHVAFEQRRRRRTRTCLRSTDTHEQLHFSHRFKRVLRPLSVDYIGFFRRRCRLFHSFFFSFIDDITTTKTDEKIIGTRNRRAVKQGVSVRRGEAVLTTETMTH
jgi:hypothetical protein